jgi:hypothetical protein
LVGEKIESVDEKLWKDAMIKEIQSLHKNETFNLVKLPSGRNYVCRKWVLKKKMNVACQANKFKYRLVEKGYSQFEGVDFSEIFYHVAKSTSIRLLIPMVATFDLEIEYLDVKTTFLHGDLEEEIYMK